MRGRDAADRAAARPPPGAALRRPAPARRDRPGAGARRRRVPVRRAAVQPRRQAAHRAARRDQAAAPAARQDDHDLRHPRPDRGADARRPHRGDEGPASSSSSARRTSIYHRPANRVRRRLRRLAGDELSAAAAIVHAGGIRISKCRGLRTGARWLFRKGRSEDGRRVELGVRPEHLEAGDTPGAVPLQVEMVEPMGAETLVWCRRRTTRFRSGSGARRTITIGRDPACDLRSNRLNLFDAETGIRL